MQITLAFLCLLSALGAISNPSDDSKRPIAQHFEGIDTQHDTSIPEATDQSAGSTNQADYWGRNWHKPAPWLRNSPVVHRRLWVSFDAWLLGPFRQGTIVTWLISEHVHSNDTGQTYHENLVLLTKEGRTFHLSEQNETAWYNKTNTGITARFNGVFYQELDGGWGVEAELDWSDHFEADGVHLFNEKNIVVKAVSPMLKGVSMKPKEFSWGFYEIDLHSGEGPGAGPGSGPGRGPGRGPGAGLGAGLSRT